MSKMSDLDLMVRNGERTAEDFIKRGYDARTARAMAAVVEASNVEEPPKYLPARHPIRRNWNRGR